MEIPAPVPIAPPNGLKIVVVGSINMDLVVRGDRFPVAGETRLAESLQTYPGGKGANQAVAAARLGCQTSLIGALGADSFGPQLRQHLIANQVDTTAVSIETSCSSGVAIIQVNEAGENCITVVPGANSRVTPELVAMHEELIRNADALMVQLEVPLPAVLKAIEIAKRHGVITIVDPAPAPTQKLPDEIFHVDVFTPNQTEAEIITGVRVDDVPYARAAAQHLKDRGARMPVIKMGALGAVAIDSDGMLVHVPALPVDVVDSTAAGDAFTAALTVGLLRKESVASALSFACKAGALAVTKLGAQSALPTWGELQSFRMN